MDAPSQPTPILDLYATVMSRFLNPFESAALRDQISREEAKWITTPTFPPPSSKPRPGVTAALTAGNLATLERRVGSASQKPPLDIPRRPPSSVSRPASVAPSRGDVRASSQLRGAAPPTAKSVDYDAVSLAYGPPSQANTSVLEDRVRKLEAVLQEERNDRIQTSEQLSRLAQLLEAALTQQVKASSSSGKKEAGASTASAAAAGSSQESSPGGRASTAASVKAVQRAPLVSTGAATHQKKADAPPARMNLSGGGAGRTTTLEQKRQLPPRAPLPPRTVASAPGS
jgi:hypothetical protein